MIHAKKSQRFVRWFERQTEKRIRKMFSKVHVRGEGRLAAAIARGPVLAVSNHTSWWDPMFSIYVGHGLLKADAFAMMDAKNLKRLPFLGRIGGFGVYLDDPSDRRRVLKYAAGLLDRPGRFMWIFPEGAERPRSVGVDEFKAGAAIVAKWAKLEQVFPIGLRYEFTNREHPEAFISIGEPMRWSDDIDAARTAQAGEVRAELDRIDRFVRERGDTEGFLLRMETRPSRFAAFIERVLSFFTRYPSGENS